MAVVGYDYRKSVFYLFYQINAYNPLVFNEEDFNKSA